MAPSAKLKEIQAKIEENSKSSNSKLNSDMGGGCDAARGDIMAALSKVDSVTNAISNTLYSPEMNSAATDLNKQLAYQTAKKAVGNAQLSYDIAEQDYITSKPNGSTAYQKLLNDRYEQTGINELSDLNSKFTDANNIINDTILMVGEQDIAEKNMKILLKKLEKENEKLNDIVNHSSTEAHTYNRKSVYESKLNESVKNLSVFPSIIYWTLLILWVGIVLIYLRNISFKTIGLLIGLILYPYFSTDIILWVLTKIQMIWTFIFTAVRNRTTA
jgi:hypothetical protein